MHTAVNCGDPPSLIFESRGLQETPTMTIFTGTVSYSCNEEYSLLGNTTSVCQASGEWSTPPHCNGIELIYYIQIYSVVFSSGVNISVQSVLRVGDSATITCITDSPADSIVLLQNNNVVSRQSNKEELVNLTHIISLVNDTNHGDTFKCVANLTGRESDSDTAFDNKTVSVKGTLNCINYVFNNNHSAHTVPEQAINTSISSPSDDPITLLAGEVFSRTCIVSKLLGLTDTPTVQWTRVDEGDSRLLEASQSTLNFSPLRTSDAGKYRCQGNLSTTALSDNSLSRNSDFDLIITSKLIVNNFICIKFILLYAVPAPTVTIMSSSSASSTLYANRSMVTFTCHVTIDDNVDTSVTLNLTWTRVFHNRETDISSESIPMSSTMRMVDRELLLSDLTSQDKTVLCRGEVSSANNFIIGNENIKESSLTVIGE